MSLQRFAFFTLILCLGSLSSALTSPAIAADDEKIDFVKQVEPILRRSCYSCHGEDEEESGLRLDVRGRALAGGDYGRAIVPGDSKASTLVRTIRGQDDDLGIMPPEDEGKPLSADEIAIIAAWIDQGANWPESADGHDAQSKGADHWAFQPVADHKPPEVKQTSWPRNGIDRFILAKLEALGIAPSPEADRFTLMRRVYLDLIGLPPSPEEVEQFLSDKRPDAYEQLVKHLLDSPHYGERWGRHWLDLARYADSDGYEKDRPRPHAWRWREWVIGAMNRDLTFDQFSIEQIAGDLLPDATNEQRVATGFHRNTLINTEGGTDQEEDRVKRTVDRTNTVGSIWLGMTVMCSECHSHKYDPLTQREYYSLFAFFNSLSEPNIDAARPDELAEYERQKTQFDTAHAKFITAIEQYDAEKLPAAQADWEKSVLSKPPVWTTLRPNKANSAKGATLTIADDGSLLSSGENVAGDVYTIVAPVSTSEISAVRLEVLPDESLPKNGPGRSSGGNLVLAQFSLAMRSADNKEKPMPIKLSRARADFSQKEWSIEYAIDGDLSKGWAISPQISKRHIAVFETSEPIKLPAGSRLVITLDQSYQGDSHNIGRLRLSVAAQSNTPLQELSPAIRRLVALPPDERTDEQQKQLTDHHRSIDSGRIELQQQANAHAKKAPIDPGTKIKAQVVAELAQPRQTNIHLRGNFLTKGDQVERGTPAVMPLLKIRGAKADRLDFARWLFEPDHPLTARVTVNRIWMRYFGRGITVSTNDFGTQGSAPSHPDLLDWLARQFQREDGWSLKQLHRRIVTSATYRQSSAARPELDEHDPYNARLARQNRLRVEAEVVRDVALAASGQLFRKIGGPSVRPLQPPGIASLGYAGSVKWKTSEGKERHRRGLYTFFQRTVPYPMLMTFDAPDSNTSCARRDRSNTPLQSLTLLNSPVFFEIAQALGRRIVSDVLAGEDAQATFERRLGHAYRLCFSRDPSADEIEILRELHTNALEAFRADKEAADKLVGSVPMPGDISRDNLAAWTTLARTLINLDEFITKE